MGTKPNKQQQNAIDFNDGACAVNASAGSGKTFILTERIKRLVKDKNISSNSILAITFTHNASENLKKRLKKQGIEGVNVGTFHSICARILAQEGYDLSKKPMKWQLEMAFKDGYNDKVDVDNILQFILYQKCFNITYNDEFQIDEKFDMAYTEEEYRAYWQKYEKTKEKYEQYDYGDWLQITLDILRNNKNHVYHWDYIVVDEKQDNCLIQDMLTHEWSKDGNIMVVGDYRQSIYGFNGAVPELFMDFENQWENPTIINLDYNYRSCKNIVENSNNFIKQYYGDYKYYSDSIPIREENGIIKYINNIDKTEESVKIGNTIENLIKQGEKPKDIAVLYRLNSQADYLEGVLKEKDIPYYILNNSSFFKRKEIDAVLSYLRLIHNPHDNNAFDNIFKFRNYPLSYISNNLYDEIKQFAGEKNLSFYEAFELFKFKKAWQEKNVITFRNKIESLRLQVDKGLDLYKLIRNIILTFRIEEYIEDKYKIQEEIDDRKQSLETLMSFIKNNTTIESFLNFVYNTTDKRKKTKDKDCVQLMTLHSSKGLEWKHVFIISIEDGKFPHTKSDLMEEVRLFYVGITRPTDNLYLSEIGEGNTFVEQYKC